MSMILKSVASQEDGTIYDFRVDKNVLSKCIENYLLNCGDSYYKEAGFAEVVADLAANRFHEQVLTKKIFPIRRNSFNYDLSKKKLLLFKNYEFYETLRGHIRDALNFCNDKLNHRLETVPTFTNE